MYYKNINRMLENFTSKEFKDEVGMLSSVLKDLIKDKETTIIGARIWKLIPENNAYKLIYQTGKIEKIEKNFILFFQDYPTFDKITEERVILGKETHPKLREKGIFKYAAAGLGKKISKDEHSYYEYIVACNSHVLDEEFRYSLSIIATFLTAKLNAMRSNLRDSTLKADLDKARDIQRSILPKHELQFHSYEIYGATIPAEILGGDFFDYLDIGEEGTKLGIALGDAASKGVSAAAEAMYISGALRMAMTFEIKISSLMKKLNLLINKIFGDDKFTSLFYGELSSEKSGLFLYSNAGHNPPVFIKSGTGDISFLNPTGPVLGPAPKQNYSVEALNFELNDVLIIYSDGLVESANKDFEFFGEERLIEELKENSSETPKIIALKILESVIKFTNEGLYNDDKSIVVIKKIK